MKNNLLNSRLIYLLKEDNDCEKDLQNAYSQFVTKIHKLISSPPQDSLFFLLNHLKIEIEYIDVQEKKTQHSSSVKH